MISTRPNAQRRTVSEAVLSQRRSMLAAHLSKELRKQYKRRSMSLRKGDEVKIVRGEHFGKAGEVMGIDLKKYTIFVNGVTLKRTVGTEKQVPIEPSNVVITSLKLDDHARQRILLRKVKEVVVPKKEEKKAEANDETKADVKADEKTGEKKEEPKAEQAHEGHAHSHEGHTHAHPHTHSADHAAKSAAKPAHAKKAAPKNAAGKGGK